MAVPGITVQLETIPSKDFSRGKVLGKGGFGQVYLGNWHATPIAVKELLVQAIDDQFLNTFKSEAKVMAQCNHPNIVRLFGICMEEGKLALIMEYLEKGSLDKFLEKNDLPWPRRYSIAADIGKGLAYLHGRNIVHCDLKSLNILIAEYGRAKITDFGLAKVRDKTTTHLTSQAGSPRWMAPEQLSDNAPASTMTDIYSMGVVLWEIATRKIPYSHAANEKIIFIWKMQNVSETIPSETPKTYANLILQCWKAPTQRPKAQNLAEDLVRLTTDPDQLPATVEIGHSYVPNTYLLPSFAPQTTSNVSYPSNDLTLSFPSPIPQTVLSPNPASSDLNLSVDALLDHIYSVLENEEVQNMELLRTGLEKQIRKLNSASSLTDQDRQAVAKDLIELIQGTLPPTPAAIPVKAPSPSQTALPSIAFSKAEWAKYFGDVGIEPPLPIDIQAILRSPCPFWPDKKVEETHILVLIPQTVNGKPLSLKSLGELIQNPKQGNKTQYRFFYPGEYKPDTPGEASHWVLMTKDVIPGSRAQSYAKQQELVGKARSYQVPKVLEATASILMEHVRSGNRLCSDKPYTYTRCQEKYDKDWQLVVGGFSAAGLCVSRYDGGIEFNGVVGLRKFQT